MKQQRILLVEDDIEISEMVTSYLLGEDYIVDQVFTYQEAIDKFKCEDYSLLLVDLMLPDKSGFDIIKEVRKNSVVPIIIATAKDDDSDKSVGFHLGADDYITKPFSLVELSARIRANIRRATKYNIERPLDKSEPKIMVRDLVIDITNHKATFHGKDLELTYTEYEMLCLFANNLGRAFSKEQIYDLIWKEPYFGNENVLNTHMNRLRNKLRAISEDGGSYIKTMWGIGYKMEA